MKKILIIQTASIGDVILATPLLEKLHYMYEDANIDFLLKRGNESLFTNHPFINQLIVWDKKTSKYKNLFNIVKQIRKTKYDLVINIQRFLSSGIITVLSGAKETIGFDKNPASMFFTKKIIHKIGKEYKGIHEIDRNLELLAHLDCDKKFTVKLYPSEGDYANVNGYKSNKYLCVAPASLWQTKQYPAVKWIEFINAVPPAYTIYLLGSNADITLCDEIKDTSTYTDIVNLAGKLTMLESAALMKDATMNYVNDSAPLHLTSSMNAKVTAIFCSTVTDFGFGPLADDSVVVETTEKLNCRPCGLHGYRECPEKHFKCAMTINKQQLLARI